MGEERVYVTLQLRVHPEGKSGQELKTEKEVQVHKTLGERGITTNPTETRGL